MKKFDTEKTVQYWREGADYDLGVAKALYEKGKYPYALFIGHLALEKLLKACVVRLTAEHAPFTHSLPLLARRLGISIPKTMLNKLARFMEFHIEARYPDDQRKFYKKCTKAFAQKKLREMKEVYSWFNNKLEKK